VPGHRAAVRHRGLRLFLTARIAATLAVTAVIWGWAVAEYPYVLQPHLTISAAAATDSVLVAVLVSMAAGAVLLVPSLVWLYLIFQRTELPTEQDVAAGTGGARASG